MKKKQERFKIFLLAAIIVSMGGFSAGSTQACRLYGAIAEAMPESVLEYHLLGSSKSFSALSGWHCDGWGLASYRSLSRRCPDIARCPGTEPLIERGAVRAKNDPAFTAAVNELEATLPNIVLGHIRYCTAGCCDHGGDSIPDPHPFFRYTYNRWWTFVHNGSAGPTSLRALIGEKALKQYRPYGSGVQACETDDPHSELVVDSELFFVFLLKTIEENSWDVTAGLVEALSILVGDPTMGRLNFILSDGLQVWAFRSMGANAGGFWDFFNDIFFNLYYLYDESAGYTGIASEASSVGGCSSSWTSIENNQLVVISAGMLPEVIQIDPLP